MEKEIQTMSSPQYLRIARAIAARIADGEMEEKIRISGRSLLAAEYHVSPETIRRALKQLADMKVVEIRQQSGVYVISRDNAKRYLALNQEVSTQKKLKARLQELIHTQEEANREIQEVFDELVKNYETPLPAEKSLPNYGVRVPPDSQVASKSLSSLRFWQATGATIVAIKRMQNVIVSPGPYAELYADDVIIFVGDSQAASAVKKFVNSTKLEEEESE